MVVTDAITPIILIVFCPWLCVADAIYDTLVIAGRILPSFKGTF